MNLMRNHKLSRCVNGQHTATPSEPCHRTLTHAKGKVALSRSLVHSLTHSTHTHTHARTHTQLEWPLDRRPEEYRIEFRHEE